MKKIKVTSTHYCDPRLVDKIKFPDAQYTHKCESCGAIFTLHPDGFLVKEVFGWKR